MRTPHAVPNDNDSDGHAIISLRRVMAQLRWDHAAMRRRTVWLVAGLPLFALLLAAEAIAGLTFYFLLTIVVVLAAYLA